MDINESKIHADKIKVRNKIKNELPTHAVKSAYRIIIEAMGIIVHDLQQKALASEDAIDLAVAVVYDECYDTAIENSKLV